MAKTVTTVVPVAVTLTLNPKIASRGGVHAVYSVAGFPSVYLPRGMFLGDPPATITVSLPEGAAFAEAPERARRAAMTPEEKAAAALARKNETPAEKAERARVYAEKVRIKAEALAKLVGLTEAEYAASK